MYKELFLFINDCNVYFPDMLKIANIDFEIKQVAKQFSKLENEKYLEKELNKITDKGFIVLTFNQKVNMNILKKLIPLLNKNNIFVNIIHNFRSIKEDYYKDIRDKTILEFSDKINIPKNYTDDEINEYFKKLVYYEVEQTRDEVKCLKECNKLNNKSFYYNDLDKDEYQNLWMKNIGEYYNEYYKKQDLLSINIPSESKIYLDKIDKMRLKIYRSFWND